MPGATLDQPLCKCKPQTAQTACNQISDIWSGRNLADGRRWQRSRVNQAGHVTLAGAERYLIIAARLSNLGGHLFDLLIAARLTTRFKTRVEIRCQVDQPSPEFGMLERNDTTKTPKSGSGWKRCFGADDRLRTRRHHPEPWWFWSSCGNKRLHQMQDGTAVPQICVGEFAFCIKRPQMNDPIAMRMAKNDLSYTLQRKKRWIWIDKNTGVSALFQ